MYPLPSTPLPRLFAILMEWLASLTPFPFAIGVSGPMPETMRRVVLKQTSAKMENAQLVRQPLTATIAFAAN